MLSCTRFTSDESTCIACGWWRVSLHRAIVSSLFSALHVYYIMYFVRRIPIMDGNLMSIVVLKSKRNDPYFSVESRMYVCTPDIHDTWRASGWKTKHLFIDIHYRPFQRKTGFKNAGLPIEKRSWESVKPRRAPAIGTCKISAPSSLRQHTDVSLTSDLRFIARWPILHYSVRKYARTFFILMLIYSFWPPTMYRKCSSPACPDRQSGTQNTASTRRSL